MSNINFKFLDLNQRGRLKRDETIGISEDRPGKFKKRLSIDENQTVSVLLFW